MTNLARSIPAPRPSRDTFNPYREARLRARAVRAHLAAAGGVPPRFPEGIEDRTGGSVKEGRKTAGGRS